MRKQFNSMLNALDIKLRNRYFISNPEILQIEPTNDCNLNCMLCGRMYWDKSRNEIGYMSKITFNRLIPFIRTAKVIRLFGYGESLMSHDIAYFLEKCKQYGCWVRMTTNGMNITQETAKRLDKLDFLEFSIDSLNETFLKKYRGQDLERIRESISYFNLKKRPAIGISAILTNENIHELKGLICFAKDNNVRQVEAHHLIVYARELRHLSVFLNEHAQTYIDEAKKLANRLGIRLMLPSLDTVKRVCFQPFKYLYINWNGDVRTCTDSAFNCRYNTVLGNVHMQGLRQIWNSRLMQRIRNGFYTGKHYSLCKNCMFVDDKFENYLRYL